MLHMEAVNLMQYVKDHGFMYNLAPNTLVATPGDFVLIFINWSETEAVHGVRWQIPGGGKCLEAAMRSLSVEAAGKDGDDKAAILAMLEYLKRGTHGS